MLEDHDKRNDKEWSGGPPHEEFLELCAISTTGELTGEERARLKEHLETCPDCRDALQEFEAAANIGAPLLSSALASPDSRAENSTTRNVQAPIANHAPTSEEAVENSKTRSLSQLSALATGNGSTPAQVNWNYVWLSLAAAVLLTVALGLYAYEAGTRHGAPAAEVQAPSRNETGKIDSLEQQLSDVGHEREVLRAEVAQRDKQISGLERQIASETSALNDAKNAQTDLARSLENAVNDKQQTAEQQTATDKNLAAAQASLAKMQSEADSVRQQLGQDQVREANLQSRIGDLETALTASQQANAKQQNLLTEDTDIRDLMGARDLYIAEIYDVGRDGSTAKPYGRIFYTKGKSLVFYAYDLDQQAGAKGANTFQAWGESGPDRQQALNLGLFYEDSAAKKRWVLKFDDAHALEQINAVFVTVEPSGGSQAPSGKRLLFASLRIEPNHP